jgi:hypothetical protein
VKRSAVLFSRGNSTSAGRRRTKRDERPPFDGEGEDLSAVVVGVLSDKVDAARRRRDEGRVAAKLFLEILTALRRAGGADVVLAQVGLASKTGSETFTFG